MGSRAVAPPLGALRMAILEDAPFIYALINESQAKTFRIESISDVVYLIENAVLSICQLSEEGAIIGFMAVRDFPLIPSLHPCAWEDYIWTKYKAIELNSRNTLWIHLITWNQQHSRELVDNILKSLFMHDPYVQYIAMVKTLVKYIVLVPGQARSEASFRRVQVMERGITGDKLPSLYVADRKEVSPRLRIRRAVEEDNDDIIPILERHSKRLRDLYGDYYISELVTRHPESERVLLVCEHKEVAVGVMCLNTQINYGSLEESFELSPFAGLRHMETHVTKEPKEMEYSGSFLSESCMNQHIDSSNYFDTMSSGKDPKSRITWSYEEDEFKDFRSNRMSEAVPGAAVDEDYDSQLSHLMILDLFDQDEEEVEFDIINIDPELLQPPKLFSPVNNVYEKIIDRKSNDDKASSKKEKKRQSTSVGVAVKSDVPVIRYSGKPNAFLLELFTVHPDYDERYGFDMLEVAFELFPDKEYCVISLPSNHTSFPLLEHFTLVTPVNTNRMRYIHETLYVAHVNSVRGDIRVRPGESHDMLSVFDILEHAPRREELMQLFETALTPSPLEAFVLLSQNQPIGLMVIGPLEDNIQIRTQYDLEPESRKPGTDCTILLGVISPVMEPHSRWFMRDVLRQSRYTTMFWICQAIAKGDAIPSRNMISLAERMLPVPPRRVVADISGNKELSKLFKKVQIPFSLWVMEKPLSSWPKVYVNNSIVVVGASRTGLSFIEALTMGPTSKYLTFTNVTLVSDHGLPSVVECLKAAETCIPRYGHYSDRYIKSIPFCFYIDVMAATMVGIDRKKKCIYLKGGGVKYYDELVLTCGLQFQHPDYMKESLELETELAKGKPCERMLMDNPKYQPDRVPAVPELPDNVMLINHLHQANMCLRKLLRMVSEDKDSLQQDNPIVVYGDCLHAYTCMSALLELGVLAKEIAFIEPFPPADSAAMRVNCFNDERARSTYTCRYFSLSQDPLFDHYTQLGPTFNIFVRSSAVMSALTTPNQLISLVQIDDRIQTSLSRMGIKVYRKCRLANWRVRCNRVVSLRLMSPLHCIVLNCFAFFYYGLKAIDLNAFRAINECGLVYDGGLVVDPSMQTNDPHIYGAGPCARYSRRLYAAPHLHAYYCSEQVGEALAQLFLRKLNPFLEGSQEGYPEDLAHRFSSTYVAGSLASLTEMEHRASTSTVAKSLRWQPVLKFDAPIVVNAILPGSNHYLKIRKPGPEIPMEVQLSLPHQGHTLLTDKNNNYFRLQLNVLHCVDSITCLSKKHFPVEIISQLYGKHESFFNKLLIRYQMNEIEDLYDYFTQPWMSALYEETFDDLIASIHQHDVTGLYELTKSRQMRSSRDSGTSMPRFGSIRPSTAMAASISECGPTWEDRKQATLRSIIDKHIAKSATDMMKNSKQHDIPSECGQAANIRTEANAIWNMAGGERIVLTQIGRYLQKYSVISPHYAPPLPSDQQ